MSPPRLVLLPLEAFISLVFVTLRRCSCTALLGQDRITQSRSARSIVLSYPSSKPASVRHSSTMSISTSPGSDNGFNSRSQQSPLASQRAKQAANAPSEANRTGRFGNYFTLGYKESFSQWVRSPRLLLSSVKVERVDFILVGKHTLSCG